MRCPVPGRARLAVRRWLATLRSFAALGTVRGWLPVGGHRHPARAVRRWLTALHRRLARWWRRWLMPGVADRAPGLFGSLIPPRWRTVPPRTVRTLGWLARLSVQRVPNPRLPLVPCHCGSVDPG
ncbi:hypothetical protein GCM10022222_17900 [Amycolatopsis ultiminotia]|uniref:RNA-directed DNA polymerase n=1 Tax=Amycolatopsis ultiminotia TaxID=543629 RepID=A0ABP6VIK9_9PSEU